MESLKTPLIIRRKKRCLDGSDKGKREEENSGQQQRRLPLPLYPQLFRAVLTARQFPPPTGRSGVAADDKQSNPNEAFAANQSCKLKVVEDPPIKKIVTDEEIENQPQTKRKNKYFWPKIDDKSKPKKTPNPKKDSSTGSGRRNPKVSTCPVSNPETPHSHPITPPVFEETPPRKFSGKTCRRALHFGGGFEDESHKVTSLRVPKKKRSKLAIIDSLIKQFLSLSCNDIEKKHTSTSERENQLHSGCQQIQECHTGFSYMNLLSKKQQKAVETSLSKKQQKTVVETSTSLVLYNNEKEKLALALYKKKLIPKVDIEEETDKIWNLLMMGKEIPEDESTKAWWQQEKKLLFDLIEMFIARMRVIQGDRRYSRWKGSVLDSIIGVYLTQNVSDILSSSAFMSLASKFPVKSSEHCTNNESEAVKDESTNNQNQKQNENENTKNWDELRKKYSTNKPRDPNTLDSADWEAVRRAPVEEVSDAIKERGQNNVLAKRIKQFLDRIVQDHGSIDLEWLREVPPNEVKEYLLSIPGIGLKSVECIRLLCLEHHAFPVDTNVGRIAVRLGWVPLQPLPEEVQIHELQKFPVLDGIQRYLWPRLQELEHRKLYELHYHMITFGKVFCTKVKPNCNVCPMKENCNHFASAFASAKLRLPGPQEKKAEAAKTQGGSRENERMGDVFLLENNGLDSRNGTPTSEPIIELPESPRSIPNEYLERDIEDLCLDDDDYGYDYDYDEADGDEGEIPTIVLNPETFRQNILAALEKNNLTRQNIQNNEMLKSLVAINPEAASIPARKLTSLSRLRSIHEVYELDDESHILQGFPKRVPEDPCRYLFRIWTTTDTPIQVQEHNDQIVFGSILIPSRTANRGSFPLNGTYFQPNEVFADYESGINPIPVPRELLWDRPTRMLYCGSTVTAIHRGFASLIEVQRCCSRGYYCTRGFEKETKAPRSLPRRFHPPRETGNNKKSKSKKDIGKETKM